MKVRCLMIFHFLNFGLVRRWHLYLILDKVAASLQFIDTYKYFLITNLDTCYYGRYNNKFDIKHLYIYQMWLKQCKCHRGLADTSCFCTVTQRLIINTKL